MISDALKSSNSDEWSTPQDLYDQLDAEFHFTLDPAASEENHKTSEYFTREQDGLKCSWGGRHVFCNPPYSQISKWVKKAYEEGTKPDTLVVLMIPSRTDTKYFHDYILHRSEIRFIAGRVKFQGTGKLDNAPFPSMIVIFREPGVR